MMLHSISRRTTILITSSILFLVAGLGLYYGESIQPNQKFSGEKAMQYATYQMSLGPRLVGSSAHATFERWAVSKLRSFGWETSIQESELMGHPIHNIVARRGERTPWIILGAHYDSRMLADNDPDPAKRTQPVPGADDGASGVAVLLELARTLPKSLDKQIWLVLIDTEDNGNIDGWDWLLGSRAFVAGLKGYPDAAIILDMIGDQTLDIYMEGNSDPRLTKEIWDQAAQLGYNQNFIPQYKYTMEDDHIPFLNARIPAVDIIDFDYPYWHTTQDTLDKLSPQSLQIVGETISAWLIRP